MGRIGHDSYYLKMALPIWVRISPVSNEGLLGPRFFVRIDGMAINLYQCALLLGAAVVAVSIFRLLKLSSILGYVAAGMVIGPWGFRLVKDVPSVMSFS